MVGFLLALLIGVVAGLRAMMAPAVVSWATNLGTYDPENFTYESSSAFAENKSSICEFPPPITSASPDVSCSAREKINHEMAPERFS